MIIADDLEQSGAIAFLPSAVAENNKKYSKLNVDQGGGNIMFSTLRMTTGDYNIIFRDEIYLVIERKTWKDLASSIKDGRANKQHRQMEELSAKVGCRTLYIIEGSKKSKDGKIAKIPVSTLDTKLRRIYLRGSGYVLSKNCQETAEIIVAYTRDIMRLVCGGEQLLSYSEDEKNQNQNQNQNQKIQSVVEKYNSKILELNKWALELMGEQVSEYLLTPKPFDIILIEGNSEPRPEPEQESHSAIELLTQKHEQSNDDIEEAMWMTLRGVSDKTFPILKSAGFRLRDFICIDKLVVYRELVEKIAALKYPSGMSIGEKRAKDMLQIGYPGKQEDKKELKRIVSAKLLACVPGVSLETAKFILEYCRLKDICRGSVTASFLSDLERGGGGEKGKSGRRLGKIGKNVVSIISNL
jgi:ERCC4-type nuclease